jgi:hypothetical protein
VVRYPEGDPAAKGTLARLDPNLKPTAEERLRVVKEDLKVAFLSDSDGWDGRTSTPRVTVSAAYTIENPTGQEVTVDFGFPILRGIFLKMGMGPYPDVRVMLDKEYLSADMISNSTIYGIIRQRARGTIDRAIAADARLAELVADVKAGKDRAAARGALTAHLVGQFKWTERDAALMVEYAGLQFGELKHPPADRSRDGLWFYREGDAAPAGANLGALSAIGEQKATQFFAQLASRFDAQAASTYEGIFTAWGGDVRERSVDLRTGAVRPREIAVDAKALALDRHAGHSDPTVYARVDYFDETAKITDAEKAACRSVLKNLPVVFTFAPMNLLHYRAKFAAKATRVLTVSYSQYAYVDTGAPASYQLAYVVHPASLWKDFGPINLEVSAPEDVAFRASVDCARTRGEEVAYRAVEGREYKERRKQYARYTATLKDKTGELFVAVDSAEWAKSFGLKPVPAVTRAAPRQSGK